MYFHLFTEQVETALSQCNYPNKQPQAILHNNAYSSNPYYFKEEYKLNQIILSKERLIYNKLKNSIKSHK